MAYDTARGFHVAIASRGGDAVGVYPGGDKLHRRGSVRQSGRKRENSLPKIASEEQRLSRISRAVSIASHYISYNSLPAAELPFFLGTVYTALLSVDAPTMSEGVLGARPTPADVRRSITPDGLISFIDGRIYKVLTRHLSSRGLAPDAYRRIYGLPADYPMVASAYSARRSKIARRIRIEGAQMENDEALSHRCDLSARSDHGALAP